MRILNYYGDDVVWCPTCKITFEFDETDAHSLEEKFSSKVKNEEVFTSTIIYYVKCPECNRMINTKVFKDETAGG